MLNNLSFKQQHLLSVVTCGTHLSVRNSGRWAVICLSRSGSHWLDSKGHSERRKHFFVMNYTLETKYLTFMVCVRPFFLWQEWISFVCLTPARSSSFYKKSNRTRRLQSCFWWDPRGTALDFWRTRVSRGRQNPPGLTSPVKGELPADALVELIGTDTFRSEFQKLAGGPPEQPVGLSSLAVKRLSGGR